MTAKRPPGARYMKPGKTPAEVRSLARAHTELSIKILAGIAKDSKSDSARVSAIALLLERGWGKANQPIGGEDGPDIKVVIRHIVGGPETAAS